MWTSYIRLDRRHTSKTTSSKITEDSESIKWTSVVRINIVVPYEHKSSVNSKCLSVWFFSLIKIWQYMQITYCTWHTTCPFTAIYQISIWVPYLVFCSPSLRGGWMRLSSLHEVAGLSLVPCEWLFSSIQSKSSNRNFLDNNLAFWKEYAKMFGAKLGHMIYITWVFLIPDLTFILTLIDTKKKCVFEVECLGTNILWSSSARESTRPWFHLADNTWFSLVKRIYSE